MIKLYNSLTKSIDEFEPQNKDKVSFYSCGPTVYDSVTIGNLTSYIFADTINRALEANGFDVHHVMNITDIDDKTIKRSGSDFPEDSAEVALKKLTSQYEQTFMEDSKSVGNRLDKLDFIRASDSIEAIQSLITELLDKGFAYIADDGIYFSIDSYKKDGKKYGQLLEINSDNTSKARINNDEYDKDSAHDFALWKFMKPGEPTWSFMIDNKDYLGRPGWHIECSAMSSSKLGQPIDIHSGGVDLIFPHHENEIAQSTAGKKDPVFAKFFVHNEHLMIDNKKISKSLGNGYTLKDLQKRNFDPLAFRLFALQSHYRSHSDFTWDLLGAAQSRLNNLRNFAALRWQLSDEKGIDLSSLFEETSDKIRGHINNDLNTPMLLAELSNLQNKAENTKLGSKNEDLFKKLLGLIDEILGLDLTKVSDISAETKKIIEERQEARDKKDWARSDEIRASLAKQGIGINDTDGGQVWYRVYGSEINSF